MEDRKDQGLRSTIVSKSAFRQKAYCILVPQSFSLGSQGRWLSERPILFNIPLGQNSI
jgi:hypothetical protein